MHKWYIFYVFRIFDYVFEVCVAGKQAGVHIYVIRSAITLNVAFQRSVITNHDCPPKREVGF